MFTYLIYISKLNKQFSIFIEYSTVPFKMRTKVAHASMKKKNFLVV